MLKPLHLHFLKRSPMHSLINRHSRKIIEQIKKQPSQNMRMQIMFLYHLYNNLLQLNQLTYRNLLIFVEVEQRSKKNLRIPRRHTSIHKQLQYLYYRMLESFLTRIIQIIILLLLPQLEKDEQITFMRCLLCPSLFYELQQHQIALRSFLFMNSLSQILQQYLQSLPYLCFTSYPFLPPITKSHDRFEYQINPLFLCLHEIEYQSEVGKIEPKISPQFHLRLLKYQPVLTRASSRISYPLFHQFHLRSLINIRSYLIHYQQSRHLPLENPRLTHQSQIIREAIVDFIPM